MGELNMNNPLFGHPGVGQPEFGSITIGTIIPYYGHLDPSNEQMTTALESTGWMVCDGRTLSAASYPELFAVLGYSFGGKDYQFQLPDHRFTTALEKDELAHPAIDEDKVNVRRNIQFIIKYTLRKMPFAV